MKKIVIVLIAMAMLLTLTACSNKVDESISDKIKENPPNVLQNGQYQVNLQDITESHGVTFFKFTFASDQGNFKAGDITSLPAAIQIEYVLPNGQKAENKDAFLSNKKDSDICTIQVKDGTIASISLETSVKSS
jgi:major membrane immunogen (membrane-anchored lipoprotein)